MHKEISSETTNSQNNWSKTVKESELLILSAETSSFTVEYQVSWRGKILLEVLPPVRSFPVGPTSGQLVPENLTKAFV